MWSPSLTILGVHEFVFVTSQSLTACLCLGFVSNREPMLPWFHFVESQPYKLVSASLVLPLLYHLLQCIFLIGRVIARLEVFLT